MRRILICTGVLGGGTALTFAAAALAATLLPGGAVIPSSMANMQWGKGVVMPAPAPVQVFPTIDNSGAGGVGVDVAAPPEPTP